MLKNTQMKLDNTLVDATANVHAEQINISAQKRRKENRTRLNKADYGCYSQAHICGETATTPRLILSTLNPKDYIKDRHAGLKSRD